MKAVNQCIGRAIRHQNDYASVVLLDRRYAQRKIVKRLPQWIAKDMETPANFGGAVRNVNAFFKAKSEARKALLIKT